ncbi:toxin-activating lysine-acyltransferase [uncultured Brevundimonas sp.]|uniref:toxin-activating lysine-acyltransferase n=1 Tax=uncultured Brevundimonas sp. TaxID=213418 RepID=UPI0025D7A22E|nr:toxin-activating lysine-acyltransferase [uncultured Brevundimonas sp.]
MNELSASDLMEIMPEATSFVRSFISEGWPAESAEFLVGPPLRLGQAAGVSNDDGALVMLITWAFLSRHLADDIERNGDRLLHPSEWNEGTVPWVVDLYSAEGVSQSVRRTLRSLADRFGTVNTVISDSQGNRWKATITTSSSRRVWSRQKLGCL